MKMFIISLVLLVCSCNNTHIGDDVDIDVIETSYDGHDYIIFSGHGVIHNPKCKCDENI